jgi:hypothetical protein
MRTVFNEGTAAIDAVAVVKHPRPACRLVRAVKEWLDNVLIPAMVRLYLAKMKADDDNGITSKWERVQ